MKKPIKLKLIFILLLLIPFVNNSINGQSKQLILRGVVIDSNLEPIPHVYILYRGLKEYSYTNIDGEFLISIPNKKINEIWVGSPGYISKRINLLQFLNNTNKSLKIELEQESNLINEIIISEKRLYNGKGIIKKAFKNINRTFINSDFTSDIYVVQTVKENKIINKYREAYFSVFHNSGYSRLYRNNGKIHEKVYAGQIRETKDYTINDFNAPFGYSEINRKYWYFYHDHCKYKPRLMRELNNYNCYIVDSLEDNNLLLINCKQYKDTIAGKSKYKYKTDYLITVSLSNNIIRSITANEKFFYEEYSKLGRRRRLFSTLIKAEYTSFQNNNYLNTMSYNFIDRVILNDTLGNVISNKAITISTQLRTKSINLKKTIKIKNTFYPVYNEKFWIDKPLYFNKSFYCKKMFENGKLFFLKD